MDSHHLPEGTHSLAPRPGALVRLTFRNGAGVRGDELVVEPPASLSPDQNHECPVPVQANWSAWQDSHLQPFRFERNASSDWATRGWLAEPKLGIDKRPAYAPCASARQPSLTPASRAKAGAHGRSCTGTGRVLSALPLPWATWAKWCRVRDFHPQPLRSERSASCSWANAA